MDGSQKATISKAIFQAAGPPRASDAPDTSGPPTRLQNGETAPKDIPPEASQPPASTGAATPDAAARGARQITGAAARPQVCGETAAATCASPAEVGAPG